MLFCQSGRGLDSSTVPPNPAFETLEHARADHHQAFSDGVLSATVPQGDGRMHRIKMEKRRTDAGRSALREEYMRRSQNLFARFRLALADLERRAAANSAGGAAPAVPERAAGEAPAAVPAASAKRHTNGLDFRQDDAPLVDEMRRLIESGKARSPEDAARAVVAGAKGHGKPESKVKRLAKHYRDTLSCQS
jgi:hypothetical protein